MRDSFYLSTVCYLEEESKVLMLEFKDKWDNRFCAPGGKVQYGETPKECIIREFTEETGLVLIEPKLRGIVQWVDDDRHLNGLIFIYYATEYTGNILEQTEEGILSWISIEDMSEINLFSINRKYIKILFDTSDYFEGKFYVDKDSTVKRFELASNKNW